MNRAAGSTPAPRCTMRKHVIENGDQFCDCGGVMVGMTAAKNATVVTLHFGGFKGPRSDEAVTPRSGFGI